MLIFSSSLQRNTKKRVLLYYANDNERKEVLTSISHLIHTYSTEGRKAPFSMIAERAGSLILQVEKDNNPSKIESILNGCEIRTSPLPDKSLSLSLS